MRNLRWLARELYGSEPPSRRLAECADVDLASVRTECPLRVQKLLRGELPSEQVVFGVACWHAEGIVTKMLPASVGKAYLSIAASLCSRTGMATQKSPLARIAEISLAVYRPGSSAQSESGVRFTSQRRSV